MLALTLIIVFLHVLSSWALSNFDMINIGVVNYTIPIGIEQPIEPIQQTTVEFHTKLTENTETFYPSTEAPTINYIKLETTPIATISIGENPFARLAGPNILIQRPNIKDEAKYKPISKKLINTKEPIGISNTRLPFISPAKPRPPHKTPRLNILFPVLDKSIGYKTGPCAPQYPGQSYPHRRAVPASSFQFWSCQFAHSVPKLETCPPRTKFNSVKLLCLGKSPSFYPSHFIAQNNEDNGDNNLNGPPDTIVIHKGSPSYGPFFNTIQVNNDIQLDNNEFGPYKTYPSFYSKDPGSAPRKEEKFKSW